MTEFNRRSTDHAPGNCPGGCDEISDVQLRLDDGQERMERIEKQLAEVYEIVTMGKGFFRLLGAIATAIKWIIGIVVPIVGIYLALTGHGGGQK